ncbi:pyridoxamine 5'-phosphate oxidase family protein [Candidatus Woesearchaeota archaeon]|nr:pyridoxamine 5'-phosphate oxidase family protein [Candidatus Woesearchaeota archaeon]
MKIPEHIQEVISSQELHTLSTSSAEGIPNIIYLKFLKVYNDCQILIADNKFHKTKKNLLENPRIAFVVYDKDSRKAYQIKGKAEIHTDDNIFSDTVEWVHSRRPDIDPKSGVVLNVEEIYCGAERIP